MDILETIKNLTVAAGCVTAVFAAVAATQNWRERTADSQRQARKRRQDEIIRLQGELRALNDVFADVFDYSGAHDAALRTQNLIFLPPEVEVRSRVDQAFEHLRDLHRSVRLELIEAVDLGPWTYWIHRVLSRQPLEAYSVACGYGVFMDELVVWTASSPELAALVKHCPWWGKVTQREQSHVVPPSHVPPASSGG